MSGRLATRRAMGQLTAWILGIGWLSASMAVHAAQDAPPDMLGLPWLQIALGAWIAGWGGGAATLTRYLAASYDNKPFRVWPEIAKDVFVSIVVGSATYLTGAIYAWSPMVTGLALLLAGWLGVRVLNVAADRLLVSIAK